MFDRFVREVMEGAEALRLAPDTTVRAAARAMAAAATGAAMVVDGERLVGIFTERDALYRILARGLDPDTTTLHTVMTPDPQTVAPDDPYGYALILMQEGGYRHAPVVDQGRLIGLVSSRNAMDPELEDFVSEANRRKYYLTRN